MSVLSAGIVVKIKRDKIMQKLHSEYPKYGWITNTGHGTKQHLEAIKKHEVCRSHRMKFVKTALNKFN